MVNLENLDMRFNFQLHYLDKSPYVHGCSVATTVALTCHVGPDLHSRRRRIRDLRRAAEGAAPSRGMHADQAGQSG